ncbi:MAG: 4-hydroxy-3-methylbut-2-enyl diphosphate reductase [Candidatus Firestonebacteria bacterium RIFOXYA2_FULL_40_8]|nr:MAG: 4-hydroxy-3-methylbut-2-enyl diphosphate reductase [Candidatus Firestonebacteria bacterium RIFOXYA2_FULL_40_8]
MRVILAEHAGFCFGVKRAINMASETARKAKENVYTYGPIIHNPQVVEKFKKEGVHPVKDIKKIVKGSSIIIRTHGVPPERESEFSKKALKVTDATCPFVKKAQKLAAKLSGEGYQVVILGEADHPEVRGILGYTNNTAIVVGNPKEVRKIKKCAKLGVVVQTTQSMQNFLDTVFALRDKSPEVRVFNTICDATRKRQDSALKLANKVDIMIVVGGKNSANTKHLAELCREKRVPTYHIEGALEIKKSWFKGKKLAGVTAGASTPDWIIKNVIKTITAPDRPHNQGKTGQNKKS